MGSFHICSQPEFDDNAAVIDNIYGNNFEQESI